MTVTESKKPKRRWLRYSLRTMLLVVTVACIALGWKVNQARRQRESADALRDKGIHVIYDYQLSQTAPPGPEWLRDWLGIDYFAHVVSVHNGGEGWYPLANDDLAQLSGFPYLEDVQLLKSDGITDEGLAHLAGLVRLQRLTLVNAAITDEGLTRVAALVRLRRLALLNVAITNDGLRSLANMPNLEHLWLYNTKITDDGLKCLSQLPHLKSIHLNSRRVTLDRATD